MSLDTRPPLNHPDSFHFESARRAKNIILQTSLSLDETIRRLQSKIRREPFDLRDILRQLETEVTAILEQAGEHGSGSWNEHFRLLSQATFLEQRIMVPSAFENKNDYATRAYLINGVYGLNTSILELELAEYDKSYGVIERNELRGAIQEQTFPGLIHQRESKRECALPSATTDDLDRRIDIDYWRLLDRAESFDHIPVQIKSYVLEGEEQSLKPKDGIVITAKEMSNSNNFRAARLMVKEHGEGLTIPETAELDMIRRQLITTIDTKYNALSQSRNVT